MAFEIFYNNLSIKKKLLGIFETDRSEADGHLVLLYFSYSDCLLANIDCLHRILEIAPQ